MVTLFIYVAKKTTKNGYSSLLLTLKAQNETKTDMKAQIKLTMGIVIAILAVGVASKSSSQNVVIQTLKFEPIKKYHLNESNEFFKSDSLATAKAVLKKRSSKAL